MKELFLKQKNARGITLMALVITIIVLLILAGITVAGITGDNGLIGKAGEAKTNTERSDIEEQINVMVVQSMDKRGEVDKDKLIEKLNKLPGEKEIAESGDKVYVIYPEYIFEIDLKTGEVGLVNGEVAKDETPWELAGSGTSTAPYLIESIEDLVAFSNNVNSGSTNYFNKYIKLVNNLDFNLPFSYDNPHTKVSETTNRIITEDSDGTELKTFLTTGTGFNPIGMSNTREFRGTFDGNGKEISNIYINRPTENYVGLFGGNSGIIERLGVSGNITGNKYAGGIKAYGGTVRYCYNKVNVTGKEGVGGIGGYTVGINNCYNIGKIVIESDSSNGTSYSGGGIAGNEQSKSIENCYNLGEIELKSGNYIGGIVGVYGNVYNSINLGELSYTGNSKFYIGIGGIEGGCENLIKNCYSFNIINYGTAPNVGGVLGQTNSIGGTVTNCYYLKGTAPGGIKGADVVGQAEALEASQMPSVISVLLTENEKVEYNGEMVDAWKEDTNNINNGYPILYWQ